MEAMATRIQGRLDIENEDESEVQYVNICKYVWPGAFTGAILPPLILGTPVAPYAIAVAFAVARSASFSEGRRLARQLANALGSDYDKGIHFIGHSFGTFVNAEAVKHLVGFTEIQFTILDAPILGVVPGSDNIFHERLPYGRVIWVDNYIGNIGSPPAFPWNAAVGSWVDAAAGWFVSHDHSGVVDPFYLDTIPSVNQTQSGFDYSIVLKNIGGRFDSRPPPQDWNPPTPNTIVQSALQAGAEAWQVVSGPASLITTNYANQLRYVWRLAEFLAGSSSDIATSSIEPSETVIDANVTIPSNATSLSFDFQSSQSGDGDWMTVSFNDSPLVTVSAQGQGESEFQHLEVPLGELGGQNGILSVTLYGMGAANTEVMVSNLQFLSETHNDGVGVSDSCSGAKTILVTPYSDTVDTTLATDSADDPVRGCGNASRTKSVWYRFTAPSEGVLSADTFGSDYDTILSTFTGSCGLFSGVPGGCNDDTGGLQSHVTLSVNVGTTYYFMVSAFSGEGGNLVFNLVFNVVVPFTDDPLVPGETAIKAVHFREIRDRINALRTSRGLAAVVWTDFVLTPGALEVRAVHLNEMSTALDGVYVMDGTPLPTYTRKPSPGDSVLAIDVAEIIRSAILAKGG